MNPQTGEILGMVSVPSYDNNMFSRGISTEEYAELSVNRFRPLVNQAISAQYPRLYLQNHPGHGGAARESS